MYRVDTIALRKMMLDRNITTICALSNRSGVGRDTLGRIINGEIVPSTKIMYQIAEALEMTANQAGECFFAQKLTQNVSRGKEKGDNDGEKTEA